MSDGFWIAMCFVIPIGTPLLIFFAQDVLRARQEQKNAMEALKNARPPIWEIVEEEEEDDR